MAALADSKCVRCIQSASGSIRPGVPVLELKSIANRPLLAGVVRGTYCISYILYSDDINLFTDALATMGYHLNLNDIGDYVKIEGSGEAIQAKGEQRQLLWPVEN